MSDDPDALIEALALAPHPEGGYYRRTYVSALNVVSGGISRPAMTAIRFLLRRGQCSRWHRVDADEAWHWQHGGLLLLQTFDPAGGSLSLEQLHATDGSPMTVVPAGRWQRAWTPDPYAMVACTVSPGFVWEGFALLDAAPDVAERLRELSAQDVA